MATVGAPHAEPTRTADALSPIADRVIETSSERSRTTFSPYTEHTQGAEPAEEHVAQLLALLDAGEGEGAPFLTHALVVALADGSTLVWEHLTNHQIEPAAAAIEAALDELD